MLSEASPPRTLLVFDASPSSFSSINSAWSAYLQACLTSTPYAILGRPTGGLTWTQQLTDKAGKGSVLLCLGGEPDWKLVEAAVSLGIHLLSDTRSPVLLKSLLYHWDFAASKTGAKIVPTCDLLTLSIDITAQLLRPTSATMSLTTTFDSPLVGLLDAAIESHIVRKEWNGQRGILFPSNEDGSNDQGARIRTVWDREDEPITQSASLTAPYHTIVSRMAQRAAGNQYRYAENDIEGALFDTLSTLCAAWVTLCSYVFTPVLRLTERVTATLPLYITCRKEEAGGIKQSLSLALPESISEPEMIALTEISLILLKEEYVPDEGGVVPASVALGQKGVSELRRRLEKDCGWVWSDAA